MEQVNELDIDGYRWEIKDTQARQDIAKLKVNNEYSFEEGRELILSQGYTADYAKISNINRQGILLTAFIRIINLRGEGMNSDNLISFATIPMKFMHSSPMTIFDLVSGRPFLLTCSLDGSLSIFSSSAIKQGNNHLIFNIVSFENK